MKILINFYPVQFFFQSKQNTGRTGITKSSQPGYEDIESGLNAMIFARSAIRTGGNTEAKFLMLQHAFEVWRALRISLHTDSRNLRAHKLATDSIPCDSMIAAEWPEAKLRVISRLYPANA